MDINKDFYLIGFNDTLTDGINKNKQVRTILDILDKTFRWTPKYPEKSVCDDDTLLLIDRILPIVFDISRRHNITLSEEYTVTAPGSARKLNAEAVRRTVNEMSFFTIHDKKPTPNKVFSAQYGDDANLYENAMVKKLVFIAYGILKYALSSLMTTVKTVRYECNCAQSVDNAVEMNKNVDILNKIKSIRTNIRKCRYLISGEFLKSVKGGGDKQFVIRLTNAIKNDNRYFSCFQALKMLIVTYANFPEADGGDVRYVNYGAAYLLNYFISQGYAVVNDGGGVLKTDGAKVLFEELVLKNDYLTFTMSLNDGVLSIKKTAVCARSYFDEKTRNISHDYICVFSRDAADAYFADSKNRDDLFLFSEDVRPNDVPECKYFSPYVVSSYVNLIAFAKKLMIFPRGSMQIYSTVCPVCKSFNLEREGERVVCLNCGNAYVPYLARDGSQSIFIETLSKVF